MHEEIKERLANAIYDSALLIKKDYPTEGRKIISEIITNHSGLLARLILEVEPSLTFSESKDERSGEEIVNALEKEEYLRQSCLGDRKNAHG